MLHEALHGYFNYTGNFVDEATAQHALMATQYVDHLRASLQSVYPNLPNKDANILILSEMADIYSQSPQAFTTLLTKYGVSVADYNNILPTYKNGTSGTNCTK